VVQVCNPSSQEAETEGSQVGGQPELHRESLSQIKEQKPPNAFVNCTIYYFINFLFIIIILLCQDTTQASLVLCKPLPLSQAPIGAFSLYWTILPKTMVLHYLVSPPRGHIGTLSSGNSTFSRWGGMGTVLGTKWECWNRRGVKASIY
jgi:hypothetical protein